MSADVAQLRSMLETVLRELDALKQAITPKRAPMTIRAFAKAVGYSERTIHSRIKAGSVRTVGGRIPASELSKFLS